MKSYEDVVKLFLSVQPKFLGVTADEFAYLLNRFSSATSLFLIVIVPAWAYASADVGSITDMTTEGGLVGIIIAVLAKDFLHSKTAAAIPPSMDKDEILRRERIRRAIEEAEETRDMVEALRADIAELKANPGNACPKQ